ncbi:MAG: hypothetical protein ABSG86_05285 [Thermoguttaceae bacterium]|jgi:hypothetical protein
MTAMLPTAARVPTAATSSERQAGKEHEPRQAAAPCRGRILLATLLAAVLVAAMDRAPLRAEPPRKVLGLDRVIAFTYIPTGYNPKQLRSVTFIEPTAPKDWQDWHSRGAVVAVGHTWFDLLRNPADKAVDILTHLDYGGNPRPVVSIDEFGFDFGGQTDQKSAAILRQTKRQRPDLALSVWEMRGPIPKVLAEAYRDVASLVMLECYVGDKKDYWWIATQVHAARMHGLLPKTIVALGLGTGGNPGELWARTPAELERQIRFVRLVAPESPGVGFFSAGATPELMARADALCSRFFELPSDGAALPDDARALARLFSGRHEKPILVGSPAWVEPNRSAADPGKLVEPKTMRAYLMNLGDRAAGNVQVRLRNPKDKGGDVFAAGAVAEVPPRGEAIAILPVTAKWNVWKTWEVEVEVPDGEVIVYRLQ